MQVINFILGNSEFSDEQEFLADINFDGIINVLDIIQLVNIILDV